MDKLVRKTYQAVETKAVDGSRSLLVKISTSSPDRSKDVVLPQGAVLDNYLRNPVVALAHKYDGLSIAKTEDLQVTDEGIVAKVTFPEKGVYPVADTVYELYKGGFMNAWSIGFLPLEVQDIEGGGREFKRWELLEYSAVLVPDNPEALTLLLSKGVDVEPLKKALESMEEKEDKKQTVDQKVISNIEVDAKENKVKIIFTNGDTSEYDGDKDCVAQTHESFKAYRETKEGRVLSEKNRKLISTTIGQMKIAIDALGTLLKATEPSQDEAGKTVHRHVAALRQADKIIGIVLRDIRADGELGIVPDDSRMPVAVGTKGVEK